MSVRIKTGIIILVTLLIGVVIGILIDRTIMRNQFKQKFAGMRRPQGMIMMFERIIEPDESQYQELREILKRYSQKLHEIVEKSRKEMDTVMDSLKTELDPILTDEQKERLQSRIDRLRNWRGNRPPLGRPGGRPPGDLEPPFEEMDAVIDSLKIELDTLLTDEQKERIQKRIEQLNKGRNNWAHYGKSKGRSLKDKPHYPKEFEEIGLFMDSLITELDTLLTDEQKERLQKRIKRFNKRRSFGKPGRRPGPPERPNEELPLPLPEDDMHY